MHQPPSTIRPSPSAFSLVELSIVLVILGLLVGGILSGQALIRAAELRAVGTEYSRYVAAMGMFRDKYFAIPGDIPNATGFWGTAASYPGTNASPSTTAATCNGDGDGNLYYTYGSPSRANEIFRLWQHLANAGLIEGSYTGVADNANAAYNSPRIGWNSPSSKMSGAGWSINGLDTVGVSDVGYFDGKYGNTFSFGAVNPALTLNCGAVLKPEDAWNIDTKLDDGMPATGRIVGLEYYGTTCSDLAASSSASRSASVYLLSATGKTCALMLKTGY